jgi:signal transduction histidine kinase
MFNKQQPFGRRLVMAFTLMTVMVSGIFSLGIVAIVYFVEEHLVSGEMSNKLDIVLQEDLRLGRAPRLDAGTRFFASDLADYAVPGEFAEVENGFSESLSNGRAYYVYTRELNGQRYLLVQQQDEFEAREQALFSIVLAGFLLSVAISWGLARLLTRRVMTPLARLAEQVRHRDQLLTDTPPLQPGYANDEIGQLAAAFDSTMGQLRDSLERQRLFTSDVSHELRTPLMVIASTCELLSAGDLPSSEREKVARIARAAEEMSELVRTFLLLARSARPDSVVEAQITLAAIADEQRTRWEPQILAKGLDFTVSMQSADTAHYDRTLLSCVMGNLLRNALHYTDRGAIRLIVESHGFRVEDSGLGIPDAEKRSVFEPFTRGSQARGEGQGVGLSLVERICVSQGWSIQVDTLTGGGTCFSVTLHAVASSESLPAQRYITLLNCSAD